VRLFAPRTSAAAAFAGVEKPAGTGAVEHRRGDRVDVDLALAEDRSITALESLHVQPREHAIGERHEREPEAERSLAVTLNHSRGLERGEQP
jgi:hypothetical protein